MQQCCDARPVGGRRSPVQDYDAPCGVQHDIAARLFVIAAPSRRRLAADHTVETGARRLP